jgi:PAS domain S-box-containing protein
MLTIKKSGRTILMRWGGYFFAAAITALATWLKFLAQPDVIPPNVPILYVLGIVITSFFFGLGPSIFCSIVSVFAYDYYFLPPVHSLLSFHILEVPIALIFLFIGIVISYLASNLRKKSEEARKEVAIRKRREAELIAYRENLEEMVKQRTAELEKVNQDLKKDEEELSRAQTELEVRIQERTRELAQANISLESEIAGHKRARETITAERQRFNEVLNMLPAYVILITKDYKVPFANRFFEERFGKSLGKRCYEYLFNRTEPCENCETFKVLKTKAPHHWEWLGPDGRNYDIFDFPFTDTDGSNLILEMGIDITEQKQAQEALRQARDELEIRVDERTKELRETRDYLDNLINYANAPIIVWNPEFKITRFNRAFERLTGLTADEVLGEALDILFPAESHDESMEHIKNATSGVRWEVVEIPIKHRDGAVRILLWNSAPLYAEDGKTVIATIAQGQDITERKKTEQMKDEFISLVSHELRTPMTIINGSLRTAETKGISEEDKEILIQNAIEGAGALSAILENLLELSRYQTGRLQIHPEPVSITDIAKDVVDGLKNRSEEHEFQLFFPGGLPPVEADRLRVERILYNLVENAIKYSPGNSPIKISLWQENEEIITSVADEGIGMTAEEQRLIFEPFERLEKSAKSQGLGLGLVVCKRLVEAQGGRIWVESAAGRGSTFYFSLPLSKNNPEELFT